MILDPGIEKFLHDLLPARDPVLAEMEALAAERRIPIVGPVVGRLLAQYVLLSRARRIFELGSAIGYSTIWLARAAGEGAEVHYTDGSEPNAKLARGFFERAGVADRVQIHVGDALTAFAATEGHFDFVFNDVDKEGYPDVLAAVPDRIRPGGVFASDNALWHGKVLAPPDQVSRNVVDLDRNLFLAKDFCTTLVPIRDGVLVAVKHWQQAT